MEDASSELAWSMRSLASPAYNGLLSSKNGSTERPPENNRMNFRREEGVMANSLVVDLSYGIRNNPPTGPGMLKIISPGDAIHIQDLAGKEKVLNFFAFHGEWIDLT